MGAILDSCCGVDPVTGAQAPPERGTDFIGFARTIKMLPNPDSYDYGMQILNQPITERAGIGGNLHFRIRVRFAEHENFETNLVYRDSQVSPLWFFEPRLPKLAAKEQEDRSIYVLLDKLMASRWIHPPHQHAINTTFVSLRQNIANPGAPMSPEIYRMLFPHTPVDPNEIKEPLIPAPSKEEIGKNF